MENLDHSSVGNDLLRLTSTERTENSLQILNLEIPSTANSDLSQPIDINRLPENLEISAGHDSDNINSDVIFEPGVLTNKILIAGLSNLGKSASGTNYVFLNLELGHEDLEDISILSNYPFLHKVILSSNKLADICVLGCMPHLVNLDVSNNKLTELLAFDHPINLTSANFSHNFISEIPDLTVHFALKELILDGNTIESITGLSKCMRLTHLSLAHNFISSLNNLDFLNIVTLNLSGNNLTCIEGLENLKYLESIDLSYNKLNSLQGLEGHKFLEKIDCDNNLIADIREVSNLDDLRLLRSLSLKCNEIQGFPDYRLCVVFIMKWLAELDRRKVDPEEKVAATNLFDPPPEVLAARDHITHVVHSFLQPTKIFEFTLPSIDTPYPILVLVGPGASGKKELAMRLVKDFPEYFGYGISHTTRQKSDNEVNELDYMFVTDFEFNVLLKQGKFLETYQYNGCMYGMTSDAIENVAAEGLACVVHMEYEGVLCLKNSHFEPRYVLTLPLTSEKHEARLIERMYFTNEQISTIKDRVKMYIDVNKQKPGFFDMVINTDDIEVSYNQLIRLIMKYLGLSEDLSSPRASTRTQKQPLLQQDAQNFKEYFPSSSRRQYMEQLLGSPPFSAPPVMTANLDDCNRSNSTESTAQEMDRLGATVYPILPPIGGYGVHEDE